jgi:uncharacterized protein YndB with AHSA1/START domain
VVSSQSPPIEAAYTTAAASTPIAIPTMSNLQSSGQHSEEPSWSYRRVTNDSPEGRAMSETTFTVNRSKLRVVMECTFHAPPARVFRAVTDPQSIPHWWGPRGVETTVDRMDVREGGEWRYIVRDAEGNQYVFHGIYREVNRPTQVSYTFNVEGVSNEHETVETTAFEGVRDKTRMTTTVEYRDLDDLNGVVSSGMEERVKEGWERLAELVES